MVIRLIENKDFQTVVSIYEAAFDYSAGFLDYCHMKYEDYFEFCCTQGYAYIVEEDLEACGAIIGYEKPDMTYGKSLYIEMLAVLPMKQGQGYGKALLNAMEKKAKINGIDQIALRTKCYMEAYMIYNHLGYKDSQDDQRYMTKYIGKKNNYDIC